MISFAPLLEPVLHVEIGQPSQPRNISHALGIRAMTGVAGYNIGFRNSVDEDRSSPWPRDPDCRPWRVSGGPMQNRLPDHAPRGRTRAQPPRPTYIASKTDYPACARENFGFDSQCIAVSVRPIVARSNSPAPLFRDTSCNYGHRGCRRRLPTPERSSATIARIAIFKLMRFMTSSFRALCIHRNDDVRHSGTHCRLLT